MIISQVSYRTNGPLVVCWHTRVQLLLQIFSDAVRLPGDLQFQGNIIIVSVSPQFLFTMVFIIVYLHVRYDSLTIGVFSRRGPCVVTVVGQSIRHVWKTP